MQPCANESLACVCRLYYRKYAAVSSVHTVINSVSTMLIESMSLVESSAEDTDALAGTPAPRSPKYTKDVIKPGMADK